MSPNVDKKLDMLSLLANNMEVTAATLEILDKCTRGRLSGKEAARQLDLIRKKFPTSNPLKGETSSLKEKIFFPKV